MNKLILSVFTALLLFSCSTSKKLFKKDNSTDITTIERREVTRAGDTVTIDIPNIRYKDTTITKINYDTRTIARVNYDSQGNKSVECISAEIKELVETLRNEKKNDVKETTEKEHEFKPQYFLYGLGFLVLIIVVGIIVVYVLIIKMKASIPSIATSILKDKSNE